MKRIAWAMVMGLVGLALFAPRAEAAPGRAVALDMPAAQAPAAS